jgi:FtsP/CotA-like multicopper oxidase with cupredoxin domain
MQGYQWSLNNVAWNKDVPPLSVVEGERVELVLANQTMMPHPMHLHGHSFQIVSIDGIRFAGLPTDSVGFPQTTSPFGRSLGARPCVGTVVHAKNARA